ncbi:uncharacterized protein DS421_8g232780 [Arachis hypogaea]|nr:uncharacterized protein DS421_8g232780 [Arachis hypogaea]
MTSFVKELVLLVVVFRGIRYSVFCLRRVLIVVVFIFNILVFSSLAMVVLILA